MNASQIERLLASIPAKTETRHRKRVLGYAATARRIDARIPRCAWTSSARCAPSMTTSPAASATSPPTGRCELAQELESLERVQPRVDSWLRVAVGAVADDPGLEPFGEGPV